MNNNLLIPDPAPDPIAALRAHVEDLAAALALWALNDLTKAQPEVRMAANTAVDAIDAMVRDLHRMRSVLVDEMRVSDDLAGARVDALLEKIRVDAGPHDEETDDELLDQLGDDTGDTGGGIHDSNADGFWSDEERS